MKVIIAGSRSITSIELVDEAVAASGFKITEVVSGANEKGVDHLGETWAALHKIPVKRFPANWSRYGRFAGGIRNQEMCFYAHALIAVWDQQSPGTAHMIQLAQERGIPVYVRKVDFTDLSPSVSTYTSGDR